MNNKRRGEIYYIKKTNAVGTEIAPGRPFIIVAPNDYLECSSGCLCVPLTTQSKRIMDTHTTIRATGTPSTALAEQARYIDESLFGSYCCTITEEEQHCLDKCLTVAFGVDVNSLHISAVNSPIVQDYARKLKESEDNVETLKKEIDKLKIKIETYQEIIKS